MSDSPVLHLAKDLISRPSVTPEDAGCQQMMADFLARLGFTIEPMVNQGRCNVRVLDDKWTTVTADGKLSAHFEHTVAITPDGPKIMTLCD